MPCLSFRPRAASAFQRVLILEAEGPDEAEHAYRGNAALQVPGEGWQKNEHQPHEPRRPAHQTEADAPGTAVLSQIEKHRSTMPPI
jgi:hypothetical protein